MKAIVSKYHPHSGTYSATDNDGNRAVVRGEAGFGTSADLDHSRAVRKLCARMDWHGSLVAGSLMKAGVCIGKVWVWRQEGLQTGEEIAL